MNLKCFVNVLYFPMTMGKLGITSSTVIEKAHCCLVQGTYFAQYCKSNLAWKHFLWFTGKGAACSTSPKRRNSMRISIGSKIEKRGINTSFAVVCESFQWFSGKRHTLSPSPRQRKYMRISIK